MLVAKQLISNLKCNIIDNLMKFQITIREQSEAINGKAKYPLYKASNDKNSDEDRGLSVLE